MGDKDMQACQVLNSHWYSPKYYCTLTAHPLPVLWNQGSHCKEAPGPRHWAHRKSTFNPLLGVRGVTSQMKSLLINERCWGNRGTMNTCSLEWISSMDTRTNTRVSDPGYGTIRSCKYDACIGNKRELYISDRRRYWAVQRPQWGHGHDCKFNQIIAM